MKQFYLCMGLAALTSASAFAEDELFKSKDWRLVRDTPSESLGESCIAYTEKKQGDDVWRFSVISPSNGTPFFVVSTQAQGIQPKANLRASGSTRLFPAHLTPSIGALLSAESFWQLPQNVSTFYTRLRRDNTLRISYKNAEDESKLLYFSLLGSSKTLDQLLAQCDQDFLKTKFFKLLDEADASAAGEDQMSTDFLYQLQNQAFGVYKLDSQKQAQLDELQDEIDPLVEAQEDFLEQSGLISGQLEDLREEKQERLEQNEELTAGIEEAQSELESLEAPLAEAKVLLTQKEEAFAPVRQQIKPYLAEEEDAEDALSSVDSRISSVNAEIASQQGRLNEIDSELSTVAKRISSLERQKSSLESDLVVAKRNYNNYDPIFELKRLKDRDRDYQSYLREIASLEVEISDGERDRDQAERKKEMSNRKLRECQRDSEITDCSQQQRDFNNAKSELDNVERELSRDRETLRECERLRDRRALELESYVRQERIRLSNIVAKIEGDLREVSSRLDSSYREQSDLRQEKSNVDSRISSLRIERAGLESSKSQAESRLNRARQALADFKRANDYDRKEREYYAAKESVGEIQGRMAQLDTYIERATSTIDFNTQRLAAIATRIEALIADAAANQQELEAVNAALEPLMAQKQELQAQKDALVAELSQKASLHQAVLTGLISEGAIAPRATVPGDGNSVIHVRGEDKQLEDSGEFWDWM